MIRTLDMCDEPHCDTGSSCACALCDKSICPAHAVRSIRLALQTTKPNTENLPFGAGQPPESIAANYRDAEKPICYWCYESLNKINADKPSIDTLFEEAVKLVRAAAAAKVLLET